MNRIAPPSPRRGDRMILIAMARRRNAFFIGSAAGTAVRLYARLLASRLPRDIERIAMGMNRIVPLKHMSPLAPAVSGKALLRDRSPIRIRIIAVQNSRLPRHSVVKQDEVASPRICAAHVDDRVISLIDIKPELRIVRIPFPQILKLLSDRVRILRRSGVIPHVQILSARNFSVCHKPVIPSVRIKRRVPYDIRLVKHLRLSRNQAADVPHSLIIRPSLGPEPVIAAIGRCFHAACAKRQEQSRQKDASPDFLASRHAVSQFPY